MKKQNTIINRIACWTILSFFLVISFSSFSQSVGAGDNHSFYVCADGSVAAVGNNPEGQFGNGTVVGDSVPQANGLSNVIKATGAYHSLFLKSDGTVWASGQNYGGQLGDGTNTNASTPVQVSGLTGIIDIFATDGFSMFLKSDSTVWTCGANSNGELGDGTTTAQNIPVQVIGLTGIVGIAGGGLHALFLKSDGTVYSCGYNLYGQLGQGTNNTSPNPTPTLISTISNVVALAAGDQRSIFIKSDGTVWGCGYNNGGSLGIIGAFNVPTQVTALSNVMSAAAGRFHTAFLKNDGTVWSAGLNNYGQLGDGTTTDSSIPVEAAGLSGITEIAAGFFHTLCLKSDNTFWAFGGNGYGQLGNNSNTNAPTAIAINTGCNGGPSLPSAPTSLAVTPLRVAMPTGEMSLTWTDNSTNEVGFRIDRSLDGSAWTAIDSTLAGIANYTDANTVGGTMYYYRVAAYNAGGLSSYSNVVSATALVDGIGSNENKNEIIISPNPAKNSFNISGASSSAILSIFDLSGKLVLQKNLIQKESINSSALAPGIYTLRIADGRDVVYKKLVRIE